MTSRTTPAMAGMFASRVGTREYALAAAIRPKWASFRSLLARASARRRLERSIAHLDDRLLVDAGLTPEDRGLGDRLIRHFTAASAIWTAANARASRGQSIIL